MNCERLLDEHVFPRFERGRGERGVRVVPGGNEHRVDRRVRENVVRVGRVGSEVVFLAHALRGDPARGRHGNQVAAMPRERYEEFLRKTAGSDEANAWCGAVARSRLRRCFNWMRLRYLGILEKDA